jgi:hypothetical protein
MKRRMSAFGPKRILRSHRGMFAFGCKAEIKTVAQNGRIRPPTRTALSFKQKTLQHLAVLQDDAIINAGLGSQSQPRRRPYRSQGSL